MDQHQPTTPEAKKSSMKGFLIFGIIVSALYPIIGIVILIKQNILPEYSPSIRIGIGVLFIAYGCFRLYRAARRYNENNQEE